METNNEAMMDKMPLQDKSIADIAVSNPSNKKSRYLVIMVVLLVMSSLGIGGYFLGVKKGSQFQNNLQRYTIPPPTLSVLPTLSNDPTIDWKTYISSKKDYSFKHPAGLKSDTEAAGANQESIRFSYVGESQGRKEGMLVDGYAFVVTKIISSMTTYQQAQKERDQAEKNCHEMTNPNAQISPLGSMSIDNHQAWQFTIKDCLEDSTTIFSKNDGNIYRITLTYPGLPAQQAQYKTTLNQILSTFKFTNQNQDQPSTQTESQNYPKPSNWTIVVVKNKNISLCLPPKWEIADEYGNIVFNRDPEYKPNVAQIVLYNYKGGSIRDEYINHKVQYEYEPDKLKSETKASDVSINQKSVLRIAIPSFPETLVFVLDNKLYALELSAWNMVNDSLAAFNKDIYTVIGCIQPI